MKLDKKALHILLPVNLYKRLEDFSAYESQTISSSIREAIKEYLNNNEKVIDSFRENKNFLTEIMKQKIVNDEWGRGVEFIEGLDDIFIRYLIYRLDKLDVSHPVDRISGFIYWSKWVLSTSEIKECRESYNKKYPNH